MSVSGAPSAKEKKYDRQLRLWGAGGQEALETAHILLINATAAGTETLKNLVLPGVGQFTILDNSIVTDEDLGTNFFLDDSSIGLPRAQKTCELLCELNPDVRGHFINDSIENLLKSTPDKLQDFTIVLATGDIPTATLLSLDAILYPLDIPFFVVKCIGFTVSCRLALSEHTIVETHPESTVDLRLFKPFDELYHLAEAKAGIMDDKEKMSTHEHGHLPYVLILLQALKEWKSTHNDQPPSNYSEKNQFKSFVRSKMWNADEENFEEAIAAVLPHFNPPNIPSATRTIFADEKCKKLTKESTNFWIIARAINDFTEKNDGLLPLPGALPDMKAESKDYIRLQNMYKSEARADLAIVMGIVKELLTSLGRNPTEISEGEVETFCKHAGYAKLIRGRSLNEEYEGTRAQVISNELGAEEPSSLIHYYLGLRAYEAFISDETNTKRTPPGAEDATVEIDNEKMNKYVIQLLDKLNITHSSELLEPTKKAIGEIVRVGGGELHNISSLAGGIVAQEVIKVITKQYIPMNNTVVFDGISSRSQVYVL